MQEELITPENLSKELLKSVLDAAFMDTSYDHEGDLRVRERIACWVLLNDAKDRISLLAQFGFKPESSQQQRLELANELNRQFIIIRAFVSANTNLRFQYDLMVSGGITKKAFVLLVKRFCGIPLGAIADVERELGIDAVE
jgi:hypothetical protein